MPKCVVRLQCMASRVGLELAAFVSYTILRPGVSVCMSSKRHKVQHLHPRGNLSHSNPHLDTKTLRFKILMCFYTITMRLDEVDDGHSWHKHTAALQKRSEECYLPHFIFLPRHLCRPTENATPGLRWSKADGAAWCWNTALHTETSGRAEDDVSQNTSKRLNEKEEMEKNSCRWRVIEVEGMTRERWDGR